jgi:hypothetical protein
LSKPFTDHFAAVPADDLADALGERLSESWGPAADPRTVTWPLTLRVGRA